MLTWRAVDAKTGLTVEEFAGASVKSDITQIIGRGDPVTVEVPWPDRVPPRWRTATTPGRMLLVCEDDNRIWWGGLIVGIGYGSGPALTIEATAPEQLLARSFVPDLTFSQVPQTQLVAELGLNWLAAALNGRVEIGASTRARDNEKGYRDENDKTRLDAMQDAMAWINGPEWTTRWETKPDGTVGIACTAADRLGLKATPDRPAEHALYPGEWSLSESYAAGKGAPIVRASTTKEGGEAGGQEKVWAERRAQDLLDAGWVPLEERFTPETGSVNPDVVGAYADGRLADLRGGTVALTVKMLIEDFPPGIRLGDDVAVVLQNPDLPPGGVPNIVQYAPGISLLVGPQSGLYQTAAGVWVDEWARPVQIVADARVLGWQLSPVDGQLVWIEPVLDLRGVSW